VRLFQERQISLNMVIALPSLDGIKRAVELRLGVALLPSAGPITEIASGGSSPSRSPVFRWRRRR
jgi:hypothetical protein